jgi:ATP-binding cassette, subfamily F, member 3
VDFPGGVLRATTGSVSDYLRRRHSEMEQTQTAQRDTAGQTVEKKSALHLEKERKREEAALRQERYKKSKPVRNAIAGVEKKIAVAEKKKADLEAALGNEDTYHDAEHAKAVSADYKTVTSDLAYLYDQWAKLQEEMEQIGGTEE